MELCAWVPDSERWEEGSIACKAGPYDLMHEPACFLIPVSRLSVPQGELGSHALKAEARSPDDCGEQWTMKWVENNLLVLIHGDFGVVVAAAGLTCPD